MNGYRVTYVNPIRNSAESTEATEDQLNQRVHTLNNQVCWRFNDYHPHCVILKIEKCYLPSRDEITMGGRYGCE